MYQINHRIVLHSICHRSLILVFSIALSIISLIWSLPNANGMHLKVWINDENIHPISPLHCPVCGMHETSDMNYIELLYGQRIYTCGMHPHVFPLYHTSKVYSDTAYMATNIAEFIVPELECTQACEACVFDLRDPISGVRITEGSYYFICLQHGQKLYFYTPENREKYLDMITKVPRYQVVKLICQGNVCEEQHKLDVLSEKAQSFIYTETKNQVEVNHEMMEESFCQGEGSTMLNGFQWTYKGSCLILFFSSWLINTFEKYILLILCSFIIGFTFDFHTKVRQRPMFNNIKWKHVLFAWLYMVQMAHAYLAMLLIMTYEYGVCLSLIIGFGVCYFIFGSCERSMMKEPGVWRFYDPNTHCLEIEVASHDSFTLLDTKLLTNLLKGNPLSAQKEVEKVYVHYEDQDSTGQTYLYISGEDLNLEAIQDILNSQGIIVTKTVKGHLEHVIHESRKYKMQKKYD